MFYEFQISVSLLKLNPFFTGPEYLLTGHILVLIRARQNFLQCTGITGKFWGEMYCWRRAKISSVVDPKLFFSGLDPALILIPDSDCLWKIFLNCRSSKHRKKANFFKISTFLDPDCLWKMNLNCRSFKHSKKANFFKPVHFYSFVFVSWKQMLTWIRIRIWIQIYLRIRILTCK